MTEPFRAVLMQGQALRGQENLVFLVTLLIVIAISLRIRPPYRAELFSLAVAVAAVSVTYMGFDSWWTRVVETASSPVDQTWICDHDGGRLIVYFGILAKAFGCCAVASIIARRKGAKALRTAGMTQENSTAKHEKRTTPTQAAGGSIACVVLARMLATTIPNIATGPASAALLFALMLCFPLIGIGCAVRCWMLLKRSHEFRLGASVLSLLGLFLNGGFLAGLVVPFLARTR